jgi:hypothetical protein
VGLIAWFKAQRKWHRDHKAAFASAAQKRDDGLTEFQHQALSAISGIVAPTSFRRVKLKGEVSDTLVASLGGNGNEVWLYPNEAAIGKGNSSVVLEEWAFRTPQDLIATLLERCSACAA